MSIESVINNIIYVIKNRLRKYGIEYNSILYDEYDNEHRIIIILKMNVEDEVLYKLTETPMIGNIKFKFDFSYSTKYFIKNNNLIEEIKMYIRDSNLKKLIAE